MSEILIAKFDETEELIKKSPPGEENTLINNYIKFIIEYNNNNNNNSKSMVRSSTFKDDNVPFDITIHNNFQRYNNDDLNSMHYQQETFPMPMPFPIPMPMPMQMDETIPVSTATPETFNNYFGSFNEGFKDYYAFNK